MNNASCTKRLDSGLIPSRVKSKIVLQLPCLTLISNKKDRVNSPPGVVKRWQVATLTRRPLRYFAVTVANKHIITCTTSLQCIRYYVKISMTS